MKITISKLQWEGIGRTAGWFKEAMPVQYDPKAMEEIESSSLDSQAIITELTNAKRVNDAITKIIGQLSNLIGTMQGEDLIKNAVSLMQKINSMATSLKGLNEEATSAAHFDQALYRHLTQIVLSANIIENSSVMLAQIRTTELLGSLENKIRIITLNNEAIDKSISFALRKLQTTNTPEDDNSKLQRAIDLESEK